MTRGRKRSTDSTHLPANLYKSRNAFRYRNPITGESRGVGSDEAAAIEAAISANDYFARLNDPVLNKSPQPIEGDAITVNTWVDEYAVYKQGMCKSPKTWHELKFKLNKYRQLFGNDSIESLTVRKLSTWLESDVKSYGSWRQHKIALSDMFEFAKGKGYLQPDFGNPAKILLRRKQPPKMRKRLSPKEFETIYAAAPEWLQIAMDLCLQTTLRLGDIINLQFSDIEGEHLLVTPQKTRNHNDPIHLKIKIGNSLATIIRRARATGICSPYIVHRRPEKLQSKVVQSQSHWTQLNQQYVSHAFADTRDSTTLFAAYEPREKPTFHEVRALSAFLYKKMGREQESVQTLMGHHTAAMTELYQSGHEPNYVVTWAELDMDLLKK